VASAEKKIFDPNTSHNVNIQKPPQRGEMRINVNASTRGKKNKSLKISARTQRREDKISTGADPCAGAYSQSFCEESGGGGGTVLVARK